MELSIKQFIAKYIDQDYTIQDELPFPVTLKTIPKNTVVTQFGNVEKYAYFLLSGIVKIVMIRDGEERILDFFFPGSFFSSYTSFLSQKASDVEIMTLTECDAEVIKYDDMQIAYKHSLLANKLGRMVIEQYYIRKTNREKGFLTKSATERYNELLNFRPELVQQIPVKMIAQYLGIQPESLSRIRKEIS